MKNRVAYKKACFERSSLENYMSNNKTQYGTSRVQQNTARDNTSTTRHNTSTAQNILYFDLFTSSLHTRNLVY